MLLFFNVIVLLISYHTTIPGAFVAKISYNLFDPSATVYSASSMLTIIG